MPTGTCPNGMVLIEGEYCPTVEHKCLRWLDPPGPYRYFRCAQYSQPARCTSDRVHKRFCIEAFEHSAPGSSLPVNRKSWTDAKRICQQIGGRLCSDSEWTFACEGEEMSPYAYGWSRSPGRCNVDIGKGLGKVGQLVDHRAPASAHPECLSPFRVHGMAGNVDEWVSIDGLPAGQREIMKGSWWMPGRHTCRGGQRGHDAHYAGTETGVRCCRDAQIPP